MAVLSYRLAGMAAVCLVLVAAPLDVTQRIAVLTAVALGVTLSAVLPEQELFASRTSGVAILIVALAPPSGVGSIAALVALVVLGAVAFDRVGMARIVPAAGLPVVTLTLRSGVALDPVIVVAWVVAVVVTLILGTVAFPVSDGNPLGRPEPGDAVISSRRRVLHAVLTAAIVAPLSLQLADVVETAAPPILTAARAGDLDGRPLTAHPGLTGQLDIGAPVELGDEVVLRVKADLPRYWRGTTFDEWDGRNWTSQVQPLPVTWVGPGVRLPASPERVSANDAAAPADVDLPEPVTVTQRFTTERAGLDVVLGAWRVDTIYGSFDRADVGPDGSVRLDSPLGAGATWTVTSTEIPATEDDLRRADPLTTDVGSALERFAEEDAASVAVAELAADITADAPTTYDKVRAIEDWMDSNVTYTRDIALLPPGTDAVDHLLFQSRRGFCEQIGSALVVMLRSLGIPARLVVGYVPSDYDSATGEWLSRASDAHAWAEVYFPGVGWRGFDPTAGVPSTVDEQPSPELDRGWLPFGGVAIVAIAGLVVVVALVVAARRRILADLANRFRPFLRRADVDEGSDDALTELHHRFGACGDRLGLSWPSTMTLRDRARSMVALGLDLDAVELAVRTLERVTFDRDGTGRSGGDAAVALDRLEAAVTDFARSGDGDVPRSQPSETADASM